MLKTRQYFIRALFPHKERVIDPLPPQKLQEKLNDIFFLKNKILFSKPFHLYTHASFGQPELYTFTAQNCITVDLEGSAVLCSARYSFSVGLLVGYQQVTSLLQVTSRFLVGQVQIIVFYTDLQYCPVSRRESIFTSLPFYGPGQDRQLISRYPPPARLPDQQAQMEGFHFKMVLNCISVSSLPSDLSKPEFTHFSQHQNL